MRTAHSGLLACLLVLLSAPPVLAQSTSDQEQADSLLGRLVYYSGTVQVKTSETDWGGAQLEQAVRRTHTLRTGPKARAEIEWKNGTTTTVGPSSTQSVGRLYDAAREQSKASKGLISEFMELFQGETSGDDDVGGIRRGEVETESHAGAGELYWKTVEPVAFADAQESFRQGDYATAVRQFHLFLQQNPDHPDADRARLGMGLSYLRLNNPTKARSAFRAIVSEHPDSPIADRARTLLEEL